MFPNTERGCRTAMPRRFSSIYQPSWLSKLGSIGDRFQLPDCWRKIWSEEEEGPVFWSEEGGVDSAGAARLCWSALRQDRIHGTRHEVVVSDLPDPLGVAVSCEEEDQKQRKTEEEEQDEEIPLLGLNSACWKLRKMVSFLSFLCGGGSGVEGGGSRHRWREKVLIKMWIYK